MKLPEEHPFVRILRDIERAASEAADEATSAGCTRLLTVKMNMLEQRIEVLHALHDFTRDMLRGGA